MKSLILATLLLHGCMLVRGPLALLGVTSGTIMTHKDQPPKEAMTAEEAAGWTQRFYEDKAECMERGCAYSTYSSGWGAYQGSGGGSASTRCNADITRACLEAKGYREDGTAVNVFGKRLN